MARRPEAAERNDRAAMSDSENKAGQADSPSAVDSEARQTGDAQRFGSSSHGMSAGLARNWWAVGLRGLAAVLLGLGVLLLPPPTIASLVVLFAAYLSADGVLAVIAGVRLARRGEQWWSLIAEGVTNLAAAGTVLVWQAIIVMPFIHLTSIWAIVTGALMLSAARRLSVHHGRGLLTFAGAASCAWGIVAASVAVPYGDDALATRLWLAAYALPFGLILLALAVRLRRRQRESLAPLGRASESIAGNGKR